MCGNEHYEFREDVFRLTTIGGYRVARIYLDKQYSTFKLDDLKCLSRMFYIVQNQHKAYIHALPDVMTYVITTLASVDCVEPAPTLSKFVLYYQLHEELKTALL
jgi:hypothetical protein